MTFDDKIHNLRIKLVLDALNSTPNQSAAARKLGLSRQRVALYIRRYDLIHDEQEGVWFGGGFVS